ncbi:MAG: NupC/NupG family nucleoside CNT transporter [Candidatus Kapaibacteriota bacterium]
MERLISAFGVIVLLGIAWAWSSNRRGVPLRVVVWGTLLQLLLAVFVLQVPAGTALFQNIGKGVTWLLSFANSGAVFLFGNIASSSDQHRLVFGMQFALTVLPIIVFLSSLTAVLYHLGLMQRVVRAMAWVMQRTMRTSGIESLAAAANVFLGQTEAPLLIRHYLPAATTTELFAVMVGGFATIAGSIMGVYIAMGIPATSLIVASLLAAPGSLVLAKIAEPPTDTPSEQQGDTPGVTIMLEDPVVPSQNVVDALSRGALDGFTIAINVLMVLLAFTAVVALVDASLSGLAEVTASWGWSAMPRSLNEIFAVLFYPLAWLTGVPAQEVSALSGLLGVKLSQTEFLAYDQLSQMIASGQLSDRTVQIATVALCGFANVMSIGIQIGGFGIMVPDKRSEVARLAFKAMCIGALANLLAACIVGIVA